MEYKVISSFKDKFTKKIYKKGDSYTHKDEKRIAFLIEKGFLVKVEKTDPDQVEPEKETKTKAKK